LNQLRGTPQTPSRSVSCSRPYSCPPSSRPKNARAGPSHTFAYQTDEDEGFELVRTAAEDLGISKYSFIDLYRDKTDLVAIRSDPICKLDFIRHQDFPESTYDDWIKNGPWDWGGKAPILMDVDTMVVI
jgi:hypothetical protein